MGSHLEKRGVKVVGGFLQPSSDEYVSYKLGPDWAISLQDRVAMCDLVGQANASGNNDKVWIHSWRSGESEGSAVTGAVEAFINTAVPVQCEAKLSVPVVAYMVCGADLVERCGGWSQSPPYPIVVLRREGATLPTSSPSVGWEVAEGDTKPVSSTLIRDAISGGHWERLADIGMDSCVVEFMSARFQAGTLFQKAN